VKRIYTESYKLSRVKNLVDDGRFAVPELQREFVWTPRKTCELLDSVYRNYPIGTLLVWKTGRKNENQLRSQLHILPQFNPSNPHIWFLIDGQQRLSVLWHFVCGSATTVENAEGREVAFGAVHLDTQAGKHDRLFVYRARVVGTQKRRLIPVVDILAGNWRRKTKHFGRRAQKRVVDCRRRLLSYKVLFVFCETNDRSEVRETFIRVNSLGMRIGAADRAFARASKIKMRNLVRDVQARLKNGFGTIERTTILQTAALALGTRDLGERAIDSMVSRLEAKAAERVRFTRTWTKLREAFGAAADYLVHSLGVPGFDFLPSEPMITVLTLYFFHKGAGRPPKAAQERLRRWFWATAVGARYTGRGYRPNLLADVEFVKRLAENPRAHLPSMPRVPAHILRSIDYSRPGPLSNAFFCLLRSNGPRYLEDATEIPLGEISSRRNRSDKHHVFPRALLARYGFGSDRANSILNICYLVARENQSVGKRAPRRYLEEVPNSVRSRSKALRSHLLPTNGDGGLWDSSVKRGFRSFLQQRESILKKAFETRAGAKVRLFERT
jgi:hypothetical protein